MLYQRSQHDGCWRGNGPWSRRSLLRSGLSLGILFFALSASSVGQIPSVGQTAALVKLASLSTPVGGEVWMSPETARETVQSMVDFAIENLPPRYDGKKDWEDTKKVFAGIKLRRKGLRLSTKRRYRDVRHGLQSRYHVAFPPTAPASNGQSRPPVTANVKSVTRAVGSNGQPSTGWVIVCEMSTPLDFAARIERWNLGIQWYSVEVKGHMKIRVEIQATLDAYPDYSEIPPAIVVDPKVTAAKLELKSLNVDRVSKIGGEVAEQWGELAEKLIDEILMDDFNRKLPAKLNKAIDKKRDRLRFSMSDWLEKLQPQ